MPTSYVVTGANRGLGLEWAKQLAARPDTIVIGIVRSKKAATALGSIGPNVHVIEVSDANDIKGLENAVAETSRITGGTLDVLINNAAYLSESINLANPQGTQEALVEELEKHFHVNVLGPILATNLFLPLLKAGSTKKIFMVNSGLGDLDFTLATGYPFHAPYAIAKAALTMATIKYALELKNDNFIVVSVSPGLVDTATAPPTPEQIEAFKPMLAGFQKAQPEFDGKPLTTTTSVSLQIKLLDRLTVDDSGAFLSHWGNKTWL